MAKYKVLFGGNFIDDEDVTVVVDVDDEESATDAAWDSLDQTLVNQNDADDMYVVSVTKVNDSGGSGFVPDPYSTKSNDLTHGPLWASKTSGEMRTVKCPTCGRSITGQVAWYFTCPECGSKVNMIGQKVGVSDFAFVQGFFDGSVPVGSHHGTMRVASAPIGRVLAAGEAVLASVDHDGVQVAYSGQKGGTAASEATLLDTLAPDGVLFSNDAPKTAKVAGTTDAEDAVLSFIGSKSVSNTDLSEWKNDNDDFSPAEIEAAIKSLVSAGKLDDEGTTFKTAQVQYQVGDELEWVDSGVTYRGVVNNSSMPLSAFVSGTGKDEVGVGVCWADSDGDHEGILLINDPTLVRKTSQTHPRYQVRAITPTGNEVIRAEYDEYVVAQSAASENAWGDTKVWVADSQPDSPPPGLTEDDGYVVDEYVDQQAQNDSDARHHAQRTVPYIFPYDSAPDDTVYPKADGEADILKHSQQMGEKAKENPMEYALCPFCGSDNLNSQGRTEDGLADVIHCNTCDKTWNEIWGGSAPEIKTSQAQAEWAVFEDADMISWMDDYTEAVALFNSLKPRVDAGLISMVLLVKEMYANGPFVLLDTYGYLDSGDSRYEEIVDALGVNTLYKEGQNLVDTGYGLEQGMTSRDNQNQPTAPAVEFSATQDGFLPPSVAGDYEGRAVPDEAQVTAQSWAGDDMLFTTSLVDAINAWTGPFPNTAQRMNDTSFSYNGSLHTIQNGIISWGPYSVDSAYDLNDALGIVDARLKTTPVFDAMGLPPVPDFPSVTGKTSQYFGDTGGYNYMTDTAVCPSCGATQVNASTADKPSTYFHICRIYRNPEESTLHCNICGADFTEDGIYLGTSERN